MKSNNVLVTVVLASLFLTFSYSQLAPMWTTTVNIETKSFSVVTGTQKTSGAFTNSITFSGIYPSPSIALCNIDFIQPFPKLEL